MDASAGFTVPHQQAAEVRGRVVEVGLWYAWWAQSLPGDRTQKRQEMYGAPDQNGDPGGGNGVLNDFSAVA